MTVQAQLPDAGFSRKVVSIGILSIAVYLISPLWVPLAMGGVFAVLLQPALQWFLRRRWTPAQAAATLSILISLVLVLPGTLLIFAAVRTGFEQVALWKDGPIGSGAELFELLQEIPVVKSTLALVDQYFPAQTSQLLATAETVAKSIALGVADLLGGFASRLPGLTMSLVIMLVSTFFFLADGRRLGAWIRKISVFNQTETETLIHAFVGTCRSVILASLASGLLQSLVFLIACLVTSRPDSMVIFLVVFMATFVPVLGATPITFGIALHWWLTGHTAGGIVLLCFAAFTVLIDNLVRPYILKGATNLHPMLAFAAVFGGVQTIGFAGIFLGPVLAALAVALLQLPPQIGE